MKTGVRERREKDEWSVRQFMEEEEEVEEGED